MTENRSSSPPDNSVLPSDGTDPGKYNDPVFQDGLKSILNSYQVRLGRSLAPDDILTITDQAKAFFDQHCDQHHLETPTQAESNVQRSTSDAPSTILGSDPRSSSPLPSSAAGERIDSNHLTDENGDDPQHHQPRYPSNFHELAKLIAASSSTTTSGSDQTGGNLGSHHLISLLSNQPHLTGLKTIPDKLNDQQPSLPILATQLGAGKKPWESRLLQEQSLDSNQLQ